MNPFKSFLHVLRQYKAATVLNLIGLTVAFASFVLIMTQVKYELSFDRQYKNTDRIFRLENSNGTNRGTYATWFNRYFGDQLVQASPDIEQSGILWQYGEVPAYDADKGELTTTKIDHDEASTGYLDVFEFECVDGSFKRFTEPGTIIVSQAVAAALYGDENPIGRRLILNREKEKPLEIIGIYKDFPKNSSSNNGIVSDMGDLFVNRQNEWGMTYFVRLNDAANAAKATQAMQSKCDEIDKDEIHKNDLLLRLNPIADVHFANDVTRDRVEKGNRSTVFSLLSIAGLIIAIAMINFVNFAVAMVPVRIRYFNTRKVLGESGSSIRRQLILESGGIALISYIAAVLLIQYLSSTPLAGLISSKIAVADNLPVMLGTGLVALITGLAAGIYPAFYSTSFSPALILKGSFGLSARGHYLRTALISFQYIISLVLIITALSIREQNRFMRQHDMGFDRENILATWITPEMTEHPDAFTNRLKSHPAIKDVAYANGPLVSTNKSSWTLLYDKTQSTVTYNYYNVSTNFLSFMGLKVTEGRNFTTTDNNPDRRPMYIFNRAAQQKYDLKVGEIFVGNNNEIIGFVENFNFEPMQYGIEPIGILSGGEPDYPLCYTLIRVDAADVGPAIAYIRRTMQEFDPLAREDVTFLDESIGAMYHKEETLSGQIMLFSLLSVLISIMGVFGVVLFETQFRRKETGLRKVHGATIGQILWMLNKGYIRIVLACFVIAAPISYYIVERWLQNFAYRVPMTSWIFAEALLVVLSITVATISLQSYKTASANPVDAIKKE